MTVRTRFAPSPTGELHLGNARIAVLNWLYARHCRGRFILRIEDTDVARNVEGAGEEIMRTLRRAGLDWDEGPDVGGEFGPYRQSERRRLYRSWAESLIETGAAYRCYCSPEVLEKKKQSARRRGERPVYDGTCQRLSEAEEAEWLAKGVPASVRFRVPLGSVVVNDLVRGSISFEAEEFGDFVILKSDGLPTYNFGVVVDDAGMEVTHVIRGVGHLANTPRQQMLYRALGREPPIFLHVPHVLAADGGALSKRSGAKSLREYLDEGYHPDALINYLSLLSWSSPSGDEVLPPQRLIEEIDLTRVGASDVRMDPEKLDWLSGEHIRRMNVDTLARQLAERHASSAGRTESDDWQVIAAAIRERITRFEDAAGFLDQFYPPDPMRWEAAALQVLSAPGVLRTLEAVAAKLKRVEDWDGEAAVSAVRVAGQEIGVKGRDLFMPVRAAVTGHTRGPELVDLFKIQGKARALRVLREACAQLREKG